jgi:serine/threonine-protein kinase
MKNGQVLEFSAFRADLRRRELLCTGQVVPLPAKAFDLLALLMEKRGETVSKDELMKTLWPDAFVEDGNLTQTIFVLRKALGDTNGDNPIIVTVPRRGYRFATEVRTGSEEAAPATGVGSVDAKLRRYHVRWLLVAGCMAIVAAVAGYIRWSSKPAPPSQVLRLSVDLGPEAIETPGTTVAISPDGTHIVFRIRGSDGKIMLAVRALNSPVQTPLPGTINAAPRPFFFSPDSQWIGFFADGKMKKTTIRGAMPVALCEAIDSIQGGSWGEDGTIIARMDHPIGLYRVDARGGQRQLVRQITQNEVEIRWPQVLPGGDSVIYTASTTSQDFERGSLRVLSLKTGESKTLQEGAYYGRYVPTGHLLWVREHTLFGVRFDPVRQEMKGSPLALVEDDIKSSPMFGSGGQFDVSRNGTLVYLAGKTFTSPVVWMDAEGKEQQLLSPGYYREPRLSPDGSQMMLTVGEGHTDIYLHDLKSGALSRRWVLQDSSSQPQWSGDGRHIAFRSKGQGTGAIWWMRTDGVGKPHELYRAAHGIDSFTLSPDEQQLIVKPFGYEIFSVKLDTRDADHPKPGRPELFLHRTRPGFTGAFSPDGRWVAYSSNEPGNAGIFVRPAAVGRPEKWQVFVRGQFPVWSRHDRSLFYEDSDGYLYRVEYDWNGESFSPGKPKLWVDRRISSAGSQFFDLAPDGKRIMAVQSADTATRTANLHVTFVLNFFDELRRLPDR